ncbi:hypothetical protein ACJJTC_018495 [Scirpophaga incertulas]
MTVGDVKTAQGLNELNKYLAEKSYVSGYTPSQADIQVFEQVGKAPAASLPHLVQRPQPQPAASKDDDDDLDLFGSGDEEEDAEAAKIREERLKAYADKKSKKPATYCKILSHS